MFKAAMYRTKLLEPSLKHSIQHLISAKSWDTAAFNPQWPLVGFPGAHLLRGASLKPRLVLGRPMTGDLGNHFRSQPSSQLWDHRSEKCRANTPGVHQLDLLIG